MRRADGVPARPGPHRPLEAFPTVEGEDAGLHRSGGRSLPHAHDSHARDDCDLACRRPGAPPQRGSDGGDRARARHGAYAVRACRRGRARRGSLQQRFGRRFRHNEQSLRIARSLNLTHEVCDGILTHTGEREPESLEGKIVRLVDRVAYINHDIDDAVRYGLLSEDDLPLEEIAILGELARRGSTRSCTTSSTRPTASTTSGSRRRWGRRCSRCAHSCSTACIWGRKPRPSTRRRTR